jgi:hypothetical protein
VSPVIQLQFIESLVVLQQVEEKKLNWRAFEKFGKNGYA